MANYLYNGVEFVPLPEWDKVKYPYAAMTIFLNSKGIATSASLNCFTKIEYGKSEGMGDSWCLLPTNEYLTCMYYGFDGYWAEFELADSAIAVSAFVDDRDDMFVPSIGWSNFDILNEDGTVYLPASYPIDAETGEEIRIYDPNYIPVVSVDIHPASFTEGLLFG